MNKKAINWSIFIILISLIIIGLKFKGNLTNYASEVIKNQTSSKDTSVENTIIDSLYNYTQNDKNYKITFLEFGAVGCIACNKMEKVMIEIKNKFPKNVNVKFINLLIAKNQLLINHFGIATIPTQILLNNKGKEIYRHTGYISTDKLQQVILNNID